MGGAHVQGDRGLRGHGRRAESHLSVEAKFHVISAPREGVIFPRTAVGIGVDDEHHCLSHPHGLEALVVH